MGGVNFKVVDFYKKGVDFNSKTGVKDFWLTYLWIGLITIPIIALSSKLYPQSIVLFGLVALFQVVNVIPTIAMLTRRVRDMGLEPCNVVPLMITLPTILSVINGRVSLLFLFGVVIFISIKQDYFLNEKVEV